MTFLVAWVTFHRPECFGKTDAKMGSFSEDTHKTEGPPEGLGGRLVVVVAGAMTLDRADSQSSPASVFLSCAEASIQLPSYLRRLL